MSPHIKDALVAKVEKKLGDRLILPDVDLSLGRGGRVRVAHGSAAWDALLVAGYITAGIDGDEVIMERITQ